MISLKGAYFVQVIILTCVRWYLAYPLSYRQVEELMQERGVSVDHATINRWLLKYSSQLEEAFHRRKHPVEAAGAWARPISASKGSGAICIARWMRMARRLTFS